MLILRAHLPGELVACNLDPQDHRRLGILNPASVRALLMFEDRRKIAKFLYYVEDSVSIRRSIASKINVD